MKTDVERTIDKTNVQLVLNFDLNVEKLFELFNTC